MHYKKRDSGVAAHAHEPSSGWNTYTNIRDAQRTQFRISLDVGWNSLPTFRKSVTPAKSKFQTIVHEVTHLVLHTRDVAYGGREGRNCKALALNSSVDAKMNADSWALFIDDVRRQVPHRPADPIPSVIWQGYTARKWHTRSGDLKEVDIALAAFEKDKTPGPRQALILAFKRWYQRNRKEREKRNEMNIINRMRDYIDSLELNEI